MNMPFYVSPEQLMKDRADFARKGIARGRSVVVLAYDGGIAFATENPSRALHKISEIYDRIGFAAVGKYNEFENLRVAGVRYADLRGYTYDRSDVTARGLANAYAQILGTVFITESKPLEVELVVAEVGATAEDDQIYRLTYDGTVADEHGHVVMGGQAEQLGRKVGEGWRADMTLGEALRLAVTVLGSSDGGTPRTIEPGQLEVAVLERARPRRAFRRLTRQALAELLAEAPGETESGGEGGTATPQAAPASSESAEPTESAESTEPESTEPTGTTESTGSGESTGSDESSGAAEPSESSDGDDSTPEPPAAPREGPPQD
ncbi:proteasome subunit alpha [Myceligenerans sp. TRM 65318]|uniref:Proteasome subunit alpha n=1 Tax=Myceligenerans pegani TaxID=2776917 RepID=A0ABR9MZR5_9MICO|nr:proteasome subunit alpha [Myceligenerans sp. TRM 65318]MBE3019158.1 proteasome subunit alpha [Myceligenerans sp. TRM 65318]